MHLHIDRAALREASGILFGEDDFLELPFMERQMDDTFVHPDGRLVTPNQLIAEIQASKGATNAPTH